nr:hypothetical protein Iba_chr06dCG4580 [Ipomoea batatas]
MIFTQTRPCDELEEGEDDASHHAIYALGDTRATMAVRVSLQLACMKSKSPVSHTAVNRSRALYTSPVTQLELGPSEEKNSASVGGTFAVTDDKDEDKRQQHGTLPNATAATKN